MSLPVRIGNAHGFWGDRLEAASEMLALEPDLDFLTLDFLAEVSMSILAGQHAMIPMPAGPVISWRLSAPLPPTGALADVAALSPMRVALILWVVPKLAARPWKRRAAPTAGSESSPGMTCSI